MTKARDRCQGALRHYYAAAESAAHFLLKSKLYAVWRHSSHGSPCRRSLVSCLGAGVVRHFVAFAGGIATGNARTSHGYAFTGTIKNDGGKCRCSQALLIPLLCPPARPSRQPAYFPPTPRLHCRHVRSIPLYALPICSARVPDGLGLEPLSSELCLAYIVILRGSRRRLRATKAPD